MDSAVDHARAHRFRSRRGAYLMAALLIIWLASACREAETAVSPQPPATPQPLARVNGTLLTSQDLEDFVKLSGLETGDLDPERMLSDLVTRELVFQAAKAEGYGVEDQEVVSVMDQWFGPQAMDDPSLRRQVEAFLTVQQFLRERVHAEVEINLLDLQRYYEAHFDQFRVDDQIRVLEILVDERPLAERIRSQLEAGDSRSFREAARSYSIGLTASKGGELGVFEPGDLPQRFENLIFSLKVGEISSIFRSEHGFHLFLVEERRPRHEQKFYEVKDEIFRRLVAEKERDRLEQLLDQLRTAATIDLLETRPNDGD